MARNEEKHFGQLNRLILQKQREEEEKRNPRRPKLWALHSAAEVKSWIPSIQREIDFNLKQCAVPHYPEKKIAEFRVQVDKLYVEYKQFIRRLRELDPSCKEIPWQPRAYSRKRDREEDVALPSFKRIPTPLLDTESSQPLDLSSTSEKNTGFSDNISCQTTHYPVPHLRTNDIPSYSLSEETQDKPLDLKTVPKFNFVPDTHSRKSQEDTATLKKCLSALPNLSSTTQGTSRLDTCSYSEIGQETDASTCFKDSATQLQSFSLKGGSSYVQTVPVHQLAGKLTDKNILGLEYESDTSSEEN